MDKPQAPPEALLIRRARLAGQVKAPVAARSAGISVARWSQIENGYERREGEYKPVRASDGLLAHMAHAVGLTPERLTEAGRQDAAEILREIERREEPDLPGLLPGDPDSFRDILQDEAMDYELRLGIVDWARERIAEILAGEDQAEERKGA
jgi:hypothetical protein